MEQHLSSDTARVLLIALGVSILLLVLLPTLFMGGMMSAMMGGTMPGGMGWLAGIWAILLALVGLALIVVGTRMGPRR
jgi:hypothetical protein